MLINLKVRKRNALNQVVNLLATDQVVPYCGFMYTMFSDIHVDLQHKPLYKSWGYYGPLTYQQILYSVPNDAKKNLFTSALWYRDIAGGHEIIVDDEAAAPGEHVRRRAAGTSTPIYLQGRLMVDCFNTNRPVPDGVTISLRFFPEEPKKCILSNDNTLNLVIEITEMALLVPRIIPKPSLLKQPARLPYIYNEVVRMMFPANAQTFGPRTILVTDNLPRRCTIFIFTETQLNGQNDTSRVALKHHSIDNILLTVNGEHLPFYGGYNVDFTTSKYAELYNALFSQLTNPNSVDVSKLEFPDGFVVFPFDLTQKNISQNYYPKKRPGSIDLSIHFAAATTQNLSIMAILEHERVISINRNREWDDNPV